MGDATNTIPAKEWEAMTPEEQKAAREKGKVIIQGPGCVQVHDREAG